MRTFLQGLPPLNLLWLNENKGVPMSKNTMDQTKLVNMINRTRKTAEQLPTSHHRDLILGALEAMLEEANKSLPTQRGVIR